MAAVSKAPRDAGESIPSMAKKMVMAIMQNICTPEPMMAANSRLLVGGRKTSPCTSFHPVSSMLSSKSSSVLYLAMSLKTFLSKICYKIVINYNNSPSQSSDDNHGDDATEEENHDDGIDYRKPMDLNVRHRKINVPSRSPFYIRFLPLDGVGEKQFCFFALFDLLKIGLVLVVDSA